MRALILEADPGITEEVKWRKPTNPAGVPVWELRVQRADLEELFLSLTEGNRNGVAA